MVPAEHAAAHAAQAAAAHHAVIAVAAQAAQIAAIAAIIVASATLAKPGSHNVIKVQMNTWLCN